MAVGPPEAVGPGNHDGCGGQRQRRTEGTAGANQWEKSTLKPINGRRGKERLVLRKKENSKGKGKAAKKGQLN